MNDMSVRIITDSACDLPLDYLADRKITMVPLSVHIDDQTYEDLLTINPKEVYDKMRSGKAPKTSQVSPQRFKELFTGFAKNGIPSIYIAFSSELSGTYQTAMMIASSVQEEYPDFKLAVIDSKCASLGQGLVVTFAQDLVELGKSFDEVVTTTRFYCTHMEHIFTVENLEYLARGGRISKTSAFVGGLLNIKPLLHIEDGKLIPLEKIRGRKKVLKRILDIMEERGADLQNQVIGISHGDDEQIALEMKELIKEKFGCESFFINTVGSVIGAHSGPGTLAIFFLNERP